MHTTTQDVPEPDVMNDCLVTLYSLMMLVVLVIQESVRVCFNLTLMLLLHMQ